VAHHFQRRWYGRDAMGNLRTGTTSVTAGGFISPSE
jgi:hypothetical protein